ncbi:MAG: hypothetical protein AB1757_03370 [Acidobacteriota bacterium]
MRRIIFIGCFLALLYGLAGTARAQMRIETIEPHQVESGNEVTIHGRNFGSSRGKRLVIVRVVNRQLDDYEMAILEWREQVIRARIPLTIPPDSYGIYIRVPGREFLSSNRVAVIVRQPAPPARAADSNQILDNDCQAVSTRSDERYERSAGRECPRPMKHIWISDARLAHPSGQIVLGGAGPGRHDLVIALVTVESLRNRRGISERFYLQRLLQNYGGANGYLGAGIPENLAPGRYAVAVLYRYSSPERTRPIFMKGSNVVWFVVHRQE